MSKLTNLQFTGKIYVPGRSEYKRTKFQKTAECLKLINFSSILGLTTVKQAYCNENYLDKIQVMFGRILLSRISGIRILLLDQPDHKLIWNLHHIFLLMFPKRKKKVTQKRVRPEWTATYGWNSRAVIFLRYSFFK